MFSSPQSVNSPSLSSVMHLESRSYCVQPLMHLIDLCCHPLVNTGANKHQYLLAHVGKDFLVEQDICELGSLFIIRAFCTSPLRAEKPKDKATVSPPPLTAHPLVKMDGGHSHFADSAQNQKSLNMTHSNKCSHAPATLQPQVTHLVVRWFGRN